jgi:transcriptional regulator with XRE-family HTH domain
LASLREQFGNRLRAIRLARKMSQEEFAALLQISVDFLSLIERGINAPSFENLEVFATQLGIPASQLFTFDLGTARTESRQVPPGVG